MRLYSGKYNLIAEDVLKALVDAELLELEPGQDEEARLDIIGVLREYNRMDRELTERSKDLTLQEGRSAQLKLKRQLARDKGFKYGEDGIEYIVAQIIEMLLQSASVAEVFGEDRELRARITPIIKKHTADREDELDLEVRSKIRNLEEGSAAFDIEYERVMQRIRDKKGMS